MFPNIPVSGLFCNSYIPMLLLDASWTSLALESTWRCCSFSSHALTVQIAWQLRLNQPTCPHRPPGACVAWCNLAPGCVLLFECLLAFQCSNLHPHNTLGGRPNIYLIQSLTVFAHCLLQACGKIDPPKQALPPAAIVWKLFYLRVLLQVLCILLAASLQN